MRDTIEMARDAGFRVGPSRDGPDDVSGVGLNLRWFEALVRADEREACAKVCESIELDGYPTIEQQQCAAAIRARSNT
jgi:hypothetical protein